MKSLSSVVSLKGRFTRSVNLERDAGNPEALTGYVPTAKGAELVRRVAEAFSEPYAQRAWTLSGVYGTGKSALALCLMEVLGARDEAAIAQARHLFSGQGTNFPHTLRALEGLPTDGIALAVAVARREPLAHVIVRALQFSITSASQAAAILSPLSKRLQTGDRIAPDEAIAALQAVAADHGGLLLLIDEFGKALEYATTHARDEDLYLVQRIAELPSGPNDPPIVTVLLLHRAFADYGVGSAASDRSEWAKVQGRFEDVPYVEPPAHALHLIGAAIARSETPETRKRLAKWATAWDSELKRIGDANLAAGAEAFLACYPLHPLAAWALPAICMRYAQTNRSVFSFLASHEPFAFRAFLDHAPADNNPPATLKPHHLYDYFTETAQLAASGRPEFSRWLEVQERVAECRHLAEPLVNLVKTIGLFNLLALSGALRASRQLVAWAMSDTPSEVQIWQARIDELLSNRVIEWRRQADELRVWSGSDFDIEGALLESRDSVTEPLKAMLERLAPLPPVVARRHSYESGTLRYFERRYQDDMAELTTLTPHDPTADGLLVHWLGAHEALEQADTSLSDARPLVVVSADDQERLRRAAIEVLALDRLLQTAPALHIDGIGRRELQHRLMFARISLDSEVAHAFGTHADSVVVAGEGEIGASRGLNAHLSKRCDDAYPQGPRLWNELLNRRELTSQGAKARRELIAAMLSAEGQPDLGLAGNGPEVSMARSALFKTDLYAKREGGYRFGQPNVDMAAVYAALEGLFATGDGTQAVDQIFLHLQRPPFGLKAGPFPVLLAAFVIAQGETLGFYQDGTFVPRPGAEHFDLLVKHPGRFALKSFHLKGLRAAFLATLTATLGVEAPQGLPSLVGMMKHLFATTRRWPPFTRNTRQGLDADATALRDVLLAAREPDHLLFTALPEALGFAPLTADEAASTGESAAIAERVSLAIAALDAAYTALLNRATNSLSQNFATPSDPVAMRTALRERAKPVAAYLERSVTSPRHPDATLRRFLIACADGGADDRAWLESVLMIAMDKPVESWGDSEAEALPLALRDLARRFHTLEALQAPDQTMPDLSDRGQARVWWSGPDGEDAGKVLRVSEQQRQALGHLLNQTLAAPELVDDPAAREAFVAALLEQIINRPNPDRPTPPIPVLES